MGESENDNPLTTFLGALDNCLKDGSFIRMSLGKYRGADAELRRVTARLISLKEEANLQLTIHHRTKDVTRNVLMKDADCVLREYLEQGFKSVHLFTASDDLQLEFNRRGKGRLRRSRPTMTGKQTGQHNREKSRMVDPNHAWLRELGVTNAQGKVLPSMADKWRQINRFVEILDSSIKGTALEDKDGIQVVDFGSGKGYLTFAMHAHLRQARTLGVELRAALVEKCNQAAANGGVDGLEFRAGDIGNCELDQLDIMIALHACDTATDLAIHQGISKGAGLILCAPCCHKEVRPQIRMPEVLEPMLRHGIHLGTQADMLTDTLRALLLEASGYSVKVFEFISLEHTSKNKMITAVKTGTGKRAEAARDEFRELKEFYGIDRQCLEQLLEAGP